MRQSIKTAFNTKERQECKIEKVANNTYYFHPMPGVEAWRLHNTNVVEVDHHKDTITLRSGGWETNTTRDRINRYAERTGVTQHDFEWTVWIDIKGISIPIPFISGMVLAYSERKRLENAQNGLYGPEIRLKLLYAA